MNISYTIARDLVWNVNRKGVKRRSESRYRAHSIKRVLEGVRTAKGGGESPGWKNSRQGGKEGVGSIIVANYKPRQCS